MKGWSVLSLKVTENQPSLAVSAQTTHTSMKYFHIFDVIVTFAWQ